MDIAFILQLLINGLVVGMVYAMIATGLSLIFGVLEIVNFAQGEFYMLGAMLAWWLTTRYQLPYWAMIAAVTVASFAAGYLLFVGLLSGMRGADFERSMLLTLGLSMVLQNGAIYLFTTDPRMVPSEYSYQSVTFGDVRVSVLRLLAVGLGTVAFVLLWGLLHHTRIGKAMRAVAQNRDAALMVGIDPYWVSGIAVAVGVGLSGLAGAALAPVYSVHPLMGFAFIFKAFALVIIGGLGNVAGTGIAAIVLGVLESLAGGFASPVLVDAMAFIAMIAVLLVRPQGLFGRGVRI
ncbi:MAG: branched-chain amino acid ABC transporter permease [Acetobacteraceae bacterium]